MKIAIDCRMKHGVATVVRNIAPYVAEEVNELFVLGDPKRFTEWWPEGLRASVVEFMSPVYGIREQIEFPLSGIRSCDLLHVPHFNIPVRKLPFPLLVTINDVAHLADVLPIGWGYKQAARLYYSHAVTRADHIITLSEFSKNEIMSRLRVLPEKITVIPCAVDHKLFHPADRQRIQQVASRLQITMPYLMISGSVRPHKNIGRALKAFAELKRRYQIPHQLLIVGEREGFRINSELPDVADEVKASIMFTGYINDDNLVALYSGADVFVFPSLYEGFGLPPLEAMACGAPVAVSNAASIPEVVGDAGVYFDPYSVDEIVEAVTSLVNDPVKRKHAVSNSLRRAEMFQWSASAQQYLQVYKNIVGGGR